MYPTFKCSPHLPLNEFPPKKISMYIYLDIFSKINYLYLIFIVIILSVYALKQYRKYAKKKIQNVKICIINILLKTL